MWLITNCQVIFKKIIRICDIINKIRLPFYPVSLTLRCQYLLMVGWFQESDGSLWVPWNWLTCVILFLFLLHSKSQSPGTRCSLYLATHSVLPRASLSRHDKFIFYSCNSPAETPRLLRAAILLAFSCGFLTVPSSLKTQPSTPCNSFLTWVYKAHLLSSVAFYTLLSVHSHLLDQDTESWVSSQSFIPFF